MKQSVINAIRNSKGRFFGLRTKQGETLNAQLVGETPQYFRLYDRNNDTSRTLAKTSVQSVSIGGRVVR